MAIEVQSITNRHSVAHALVEISVDDVNDNRPIFVGLPYNLVLSTDSPASSFIGKIQAVDIDAGVNGEVRYSIVSGDRPNGDSLFALNSLTGSLSLARAVDEERDPDNFTLLVMAKDLGRLGSSCNSG